MGDLCQILLVTEKQKPYFRMLNLSLSVNSPCSEFYFQQQQKKKKKNVSQDFFFFFRFLSDSNVPLFDPQKSILLIVICVVAAEHQDQ